VGQPNEGCCSQSRLRPPGIRRTSTPGVYFADADLVCTGFLCFGRDNEIVYEWSIPRIMSGNPRIVGNPVKVGSDRVEV
ncbi:MAG: hypothetical protein ACQEWV_33730, partial [Bacillota bacterium]